MANPLELPVVEVLPSLLAALDRSPSVILRAPPGAGKTTLVPLALLKQLPLATANRASARRIIITQPRRLAARSTATRLAQLHGSDLGSTIGYQVRMERRWNQSTQIIAMTTGVLLRRLLHDPFLDDFDAVILDEFHERALELDLVLGLLLRLQQTVRPELKILVMSATMECGPIAEFLGGAPVIESSGRCFEVSVRYNRSAALDRVEASVASVLPDALAATPGHLLVFLPGVGEIMRTEQAIQAIALAHQVEILRLFGEMAPAEQDRVLAPSNRRKIVLATNVAETSLTIEGVTGVIDSGLVRVLRYHPEVGLSRLVLESNSLASADQRAGRAGRQAPGVCFRLWPESMNRTRTAFDTPEILRGDLSGALLQLAGMGEYDCEDFPWLTPPKPAAVETSRTLLNWIGALFDQRITPEGQSLLRLPVSPRLAKLILAAKRLGVARRGALAAALLSERDVFRTNRSSEIRGGRTKPSVSSAACRSDSDLVDRVSRIENLLAGGSDPDVSRAAVQSIERTATQLLRVLDDPPAESEDQQQESDGPASSQTGGSLSGRQTATTDSPRELDADLNLRRAIAEAYPDRVARRRVGNSDRALMVGKIGVKLAPLSSVKDAELFACIEVEHREGDSEVRLASAIEATWLPEHRLRRVTEYFFNPTTRSVQARKRTYWLDLIIEEHPAPLTDATQVATILLQEVFQQWESLFPMDNPDVANYLARIRWARQVFPNDGWPEISVNDLKRLATQLCHGKKSLDEVKQSAWIDYLPGLLTYEQQSRLNDLAPIHWQAPSGNRIKVDYASTDQPRISVRLQELFGLSETPRLLGGRVVCLLELLGPNYRPQQLTSDLTSFWQNTYPNVRKELVRRYPKHHWPEDPRTAAATRSGLKRDVK